MENTKEKNTTYLTINDMVELFKVNRSTIYRWCKNGFLKKYGMGRRVYFKSHEVEEALHQV